MPYRNKKYVVNDKGRECSGCGIFKPWSEFCKHERGANGHQSRCRDCFRAYIPGRKKQKEYLVTDDGRECSQCGELKAWDEFHRRTDGIHGRMSLCKVCVGIKSRNDKAQGRIRGAELTRKYGITLEQYKRLFNEQGGVCAICGKEETNRRVKSENAHYLSVDHDHVTDAVRGLLCQRCNAAIGMVNDNIELLQRAIDYLRKYST